MSSQLTEFLILRVLLNEIQTLQRLTIYVLDDGLHELNMLQFCHQERGIHLIHLQKKRANGVIKSRLGDNYLINIDENASPINVRQADLGNKREDGPCCLGIRVDLSMG